MVRRWTAGAGKAAVAWSGIGVGRCAPARGAIPLPGLSLRRLTGGGGRTRMAARAGPGCSGPLSSLHRCGTTLPETPADAGLPVAWSAPHTLAGSIFAG